MPSVDPKVLAEKQRRKRANHAARLSQTQSSETSSGPSSIPFPTFDNGMSLSIMRMILFVVKLMNLCSIQHTSHAKSVFFF